MVKNWHSICLKKIDRYSQIMLLLLCITLFASVRAQSDILEVTIEQGVVRGHRYENTSVFSFENIPYATVPTGPDRFKAALPPPTWQDTFDAVSRNIVCLQLPAAGEGMQEDCLVANVFIPENAENLPVMVVVHGGAYISGSGEMLRYTNLVNTQKIIVVTFNYRLGVTGFLCLGTRDIPGNAGMKDQVALLRWVNKNIASFGGNPDDVTISGSSAGGSSIDLLTLSPMTNGLFKKVISSSGSALGNLGAQMNPTDMAKRFARTLGFENVNDIDALEAFFKNVPNDVYLQNYGIANYMVGDFQTVFFTPCVEVDHGEGVERFLSDSPWKIITDGNYVQLPILYGFTEIEGSVRIMDFYNSYNEIEENFANFLPTDLQFETEEKRREVADAVKQFYFDGKPIQESFREYLEYFTDILFAYPILRTVHQRLVSKNETMYLYEYLFFDESTKEINPSIIDTSILPEAIEASLHFDQEVIIADNVPQNATADFLAMRTRMREIWLNFVQTGIPSATDLPAWPPVSNKRSPLMSLKNESEVLSTFFAERRAAMWDELYSEYSVHPISPVNAAIPLLSSILPFICLFALMLRI